MFGYFYPRRLLEIFYVGITAGGRVYEFANYVEIWALVPRQCLDVVKYMRHWGNIWSRGCVVDPRKKTVPAVDWLP